MPGTSIPESTCDVLIVGAGPAGLMLATWMARCGVKARIVDKRGTKIFNGQADGLQCRSLEIFDSFGFADRVWKEANHMIEMCMWNPGPDGIIRRSDRVPDTPVGISRFQQVVLHQGRIERFFLDSLKEHSDIQVERGVLPEALEIDESKVEDSAAYPITVTLRHLSEEEAMPEQSKNGAGTSDGLFRSNLAADDSDDLIRKSQGKEGTSEIVKAKYMVGCDGAHSWTRRQLGWEMQGEATDYIWGVLDIIPITDFPDIRFRCAIHSENNGSLMVIPRERGLVRLYIQLKEIVPDSSGRADRSRITPAVILRAAQKILDPYKLTYDYCDWWTAYQIGQRVGTNFDAHQRIFLAGDAVHTHSPKAGQGMNVSMQDSFNLGWKIGLVVNGRCPRSILKTYQSERRRIAQDLITFDHRFSRLFSGRPAKDVLDQEGVSMAEFKQAFVKGNEFASGLSVDYGASMLVAKDGSSVEQGDGTDVGAASSASGKQVVGKQQLCSNIRLGMRFPSFKVLNQSDARPWHFQERLLSDGRFRIILFAGNVSSATQKERVDSFCATLDAPKSFIRRITPPTAKIDSVVDILTLHSAKRTDVELLRDFPSILHPFDDKTGWDYAKVYVDDESFHEGHGQAYKNYGVDPERGCVVVLRPDQYVGYIGEIEDVSDLEAYFGGVMIERGVNGS
ncbi:phenol hydroxylase [Saccharata proteae CBS 121410]|uniref:Phenol hydroxylase n=1 Tax=Saccharata proteae CBS 121410 TaxID=1314787 RepID=A0A9P4HYP6_9PEZI|nr:phenol hydroxylase [Saccharata proteae CBS 121410]